MALNGCRGALMEVWAGMRRFVVFALAFAATGAVSIALGTSSPINTGTGGALQSASRVGAPAQRATFAFTGDILTHRPVNLAARQPNGSFDYSPMFARIAPLLSWADVSICHLEQPVAPAGSPVIVGPVLHSVASSIAPALRSAGYTRCSTASNHSLDRGTAGIDATVAALTGAGLGQSGMARTPSESVAQVFDVNGIAAAHLSYSFTLGGYLAPGDSWRANLIDPAVIIAHARDARVRGAEVVIVSLHWGSSSQVAPSASQRQIAETITAAGDIDVIVGHHAHVLQPIEQVNGTWVMWGLGNFLSNMPTGSFPPSSQDGLIGTIAFTRDDLGGVVAERPLVYPTWCDKDSGFVIRPTSDSTDQSLSLSVRSELAASEVRTRSLLGAFLGPS